MVPLQQEEAVDGVEDAVIPEEREVDADEGAGREVEEADEPAQLSVSRVEAVALGQHHPPPWVEAPVDDATAARARGAGAPVWAHGAQPDVVQQVDRQHPTGDQVHQILGQ